MDNLTPAQRRKNMQNIRSSGTLPEQLIARVLKKDRIYFAKNVKNIMGKPDFVFRRKKVAVFIDSDFWHGHPKRCIMPKSNCEYWKEKINGNRQRDKTVNRQLRRDGWKVIRIWEHQVKNNQMKITEKIKKVLALINEKH